MSQSHRVKGGITDEVFQEQRGASVGEDSEVSFVFTFKIFYLHKNLEYIKH